MLQHNIPLSYSPNCSTPARLAGQQWNFLHLDEFACAPNIISIEKNIVVHEGKRSSIDVSIVINNDFANASHEKVKRICAHLRNAFLIVNISIKFGIIETNS